MSLPLTPPANASSAAVLSPLPEPIKGEADWRDYRCFKLSNGVLVCLVHDRESKTTAAAAVVNVGAGSDPRSLSGLAHFCEHMCFLGSEKYPGENEYKKYLASHGGQSNASTSLHSTTYKFEVQAEFAEQALDIFAQFFCAPLFTQSGTSREVHAVDSENSKNLTSDIRRRLQILKHLGSDQHYFTKFTTGNSKTLPTEDEHQIGRVRQALLDFHAYHYSPDKLVVVVAGPQSLDQLQDWVVPRFIEMKVREFPSQVSDMTETQRLIYEAAKDAPPYGFGVPTGEFRSAFAPTSAPEKDLADGNVLSTWPFVYTVKPVKNLRQLVIMWPLPPVGNNLDQSPVSVLSHLLGHEGKGSSFCILQEQGLISSLSAGPRHSGPDFTLFQITLGLTEKGEVEWHQVVDIVMQHCRMIHQACMVAKESGDRTELERIWQESATLSAMFFHQNSPGGVYGFSPTLAGRITTEGTEKCLSAGCMLGESAETFPLERVIDFVAKMVPSNCFIERCSAQAWAAMESLEGNQAPYVFRRTEQWYGIDYFVSSIDIDCVKAWDGSSRPLKDVSSQLMLPRPNRFIPRSLALCDDLPHEAKAGPRIDREIEPPNLLVDDTSIGRLWHRLDDRYALPKSVVTLLIRTAAGSHIHRNGQWQADTRASVNSAILAGIFSEAMSVDTYDAHLAGLHWNIGFTPYGINLTCSGFSDRLPDLALEVLRSFVKGEFFSESYFISTKDRMCRELKGFFESRRADSIALYYRDFLLTSNGNGIQESLAAAEAATLDSVIEQHRILLQNPEWKIDCLFTGNVSGEEAKLFFSQASKTLCDSFAAPLFKHFSDCGCWFPGETERRLPAGEDIEFHFTSQNSMDENGAVVMTYQSPTPGYRGEVLSSSESLKSSAALRLIGHILREPLFDELRTKQTLGYVVSSWFDTGISTQPPQASKMQTVPVDFLVIAVLSRKLSPIDITDRIDDFLSTFRQILVNMPPSELRSYASGLSTRIRKPIQKLETEASTHMAKIRLFAPEILASRKSSSYVPWDNSKALARQIEELSISDLIDMWDRVVLSKNRARINACVYGTTFPMEAKRINQRHSGTLVVNDMSRILELRRGLSTFDSSSTPPVRSIWRKVMFGPMTQTKSVLVGAVVASATIGAIGLLILGRPGRKDDRMNK